jgi:hypothetical protein
MMMVAAVSMVHVQENSSSSLSCSGGGGGFDSTRWAAHVRGAAVVWFAPQTLGAPS